MLLRFLDDSWLIRCTHYSDVIMSVMASQITGVLMFTQPFAQVLSKENIKTPHHWPLWGGSTVTGGFPSQKASNVENVSIWWRHHAIGLRMLSRNKLEQLEPLRSEIPPPPHDYPYKWFKSDPKSKQAKVKVTNFKKLPKMQILIYFATNITHDTSSEVAW